MLHTCGRELLLTGRVWLPTFRVALIFLSFPPRVASPPPLRHALRYLPPARRAHIASLELLDEVEEWHLLLEHYALVWGARDPRASGDGGGTDSVGDLDSAEDPSVRVIAPEQLTSPFVAAFMLQPVPRLADAPEGAAGPPRQGRLAADPPRGGRRGRLGGGGLDLFPGAHLAGAE